MKIWQSEWKQNIKTFCIWGIILGGLVLMVMAIYPSFTADMDTMQEMYSSMGSFSNMFGLDKISIATAEGFYGVEAGVMLLLGGAMYAAMIGISALSKEEERHTAEFLLTHPVSRSKVILEKLFYVVTGICGMNLVFLAAGAVGFLIAKEDVFSKNFCLFHFGIFLLMLEIGIFAFGISAFLRQSAVGVGLGMAALLYFCSLLVNMSEKFEWLKYVTPFQYADVSYIYTEGHLDGRLIGIGFAAAIAVFVIGFVKYLRKDIAA